MHFFSYHLNQHSRKEWELVGSVMLPFSSQHSPWVFFLITGIGGRLSQQALVGKCLSRAGLGEGKVDNYLLLGLDWAGEGARKKQRHQL